MTILEVPALAGLPDRVANRVKQDLGEFVVESVLKSVHAAESPVVGEDWPELSPKYKKKKEEEGQPGEANMELEGDMLDALTFEGTPDGIEVGFYGDQAWKADGHLKFSGKENHTPKRRFLPAEGEEFDPGIQREMEKIVADALADEVELKSSDFNAVTTRSELYAALEEYFVDLTRREIKDLIARSPSLSAFMDDEGLLKLL